MKIEHGNNHYKTFLEKAPITVRQVLALVSDQKKHTIIHWFNDYQIKNILLP